MRTRIGTFVSVVAGAFLLPFPATAGMEAAGDGELEVISGQAGVSIAFDDVRMDLSIENVAWGDDDGVGAAETNDLFVTLEMITDGGGYVNTSGIALTDLRFDLVANHHGEIRPMTIDLASVNDGDGSNGAETLAPFGSQADSFVNIGLPTARITVQTITEAAKTVDGTPGAHGDGPTFRSLRIDDITLQLHGGSIQIFAH